MGKGINLQIDPEFAFETCKGQLAIDIHNAIEDSGINQSELGQLMGKSRQYISQFLSEGYNPSLKRAVSIACVLKRKLIVRIVDEQTAIVAVPVTRLAKIRRIISDADIEVRKRSSPTFSNIGSRSHQSNPSFGTRPQVASGSASALSSVNTGR